MLKITIDANKAALFLREYGEISMGIIYSRIIIISKTLCERIVVDLELSDLEEEHRSEDH